MEPSLTAAVSFGASVWAQFPDGRIGPISPLEGLHYQASINADGTDVVWYGGSTGRPRIWRKRLPHGQPHPITPATTGARHPVFSPDCRRRLKTEHLTPVENCAVPRNQGS
jgi:hypothetical protein